MSSGRLQMALRGNQGKRLMPRFLGELSAVLQRPAGTIRVLSLEETDRLRQALAAELQAHRDGSRPAFRRDFPDAAAGEVAAVLARLKAVVTDQPLYLIRALSEYCGAVAMTSHEMLDRAFDLVELDQEEAKATTSDATSGIVPDHCEDWEHGSRSP